MDDRLYLAASLYPHCRLGADIGTDHGYLPCHLLQNNICERMILSDVSAAALSKADALIRQKRLIDRATLICADGLDSVTEKVDCISITGMGGELMAGMLQRGKEQIQGATLILSAHTDLDLVRRAVEELDYHFTHEELCRSGGRYYIVWKAKPGACTLTEDERILGTQLLLRSGSPLLSGYLEWRIRVTDKKLSGLRSASVPDHDAIRVLEHHIDIFREALSQC